ncbi:MAG: phenylacetate--CoA ligase family protein [Gammaproteobacteria bacterium]|nr:phenylacetate--CoA ligase family protein [Gammaproteobacteria bacterium]
MDRKAGRSGDRLDRGALEREQLRRLRAMLEPVLRSNVFYRKKLTAAGLECAADLTGMDAYRQLPFTTRDELAADQSRTPPYGTLPTFPPQHYIQEHHTSGSTGQGLCWLDDAESWAWFGRCWAKVFRAAGVTAADRVFFPFSFGPFLGTWSGVEGARHLGCLILPGGGMSARTRVEAIMAWRPTVLVSTPTHALRMAEVAAEAGVDLAGSALRINIHAGEPGASLPATRARLEDAFGARVFDHAGATEVGAWGFQYEAREGLHLNESEFIFEVIDPETHAPSREGELVITNLGRAGMPVIRYRTGDVGRLETEPCPCGSGYRRLRRGVEGRLDQKLTVQGVAFYPGAIENVIWSFREVREFAVNVHRRAKRDEIEVQVELWTGDADRVRALLADAMRAKFGLGLEVSTVPAGTLPRFPVKARRFTDHRAHD